MGYRRLFIMRKDIKMSPGKLAAQVGHCAEAYWTQLLRSGDRGFIDGTDDDVITVRLNMEVYDQYINGSFVKTICEAKNKNHLLKAKKRADELGLIEGKDFGLIFDNCYTEIKPEEPNGTTLTGIWFAPLPDNISHNISKKFHLYM